MRYKQFLLNEGRSKSIQYGDVGHILNTKCKKAVKAYLDGSRIYRGISSESINNFLYINPKKHKPRKSKNTSNHYTLINDNSPGWKKYPKRSESIICTTDFTYATEYGSKVYVVLPYDGAKIGVCPDEDYWDSFTNVDVPNMDSFNNQLGLLFEQVHIPFDDSSYKGIKLGFKMFDAIIKNGRESIDSLLKDGYSILDGYTDYNNMLLHIQELLHPDNNNFILSKVGQKLPKNREVWTDSESVLISDSTIDTVI